MERWDAFDQEENLLDIELIRGVTDIPKGVYHRVVEALIKHTDGSYLLMKRSNEKEGWPGRFETSAGGSCLKGETPLEGIRREILEETGINQIISLEIIDRSLSDNAIFYSYLCLTDCDKATITYQVGETSSHQWLSEEDFIAFTRSNEGIPTQLKRLKSFISGIKRNYSDNM